MYKIVHYGDQFERTWALLNSYRSEFTHNVRLDRFLCKKFSNIPLSGIYRMIRKEQVRVNGKRKKPYFMLQNTDSVGIWGKSLRTCRKAADTLLEAELHTGRTHQLCVQLAHMNHPHHLRLQIWYAGRKENVSFLTPAWYSIIWY